MLTPHNALLLRIELKDFKPAIYREVLVDPNITLRALHTVIQAAMGWENAHLYAFAQPLRSTESFWKIPNLRKWQKPSPDAWGEPMGNDAKVDPAQQLGGVGRDHVVGIGLHRRLHRGRKHRVSSMHTTGERCRSNRQRR